MLVKAKCVTPCWDSNNAVRYEPGAGPLPDGLYEIDRNGPLALLKLGSTYVFEFDRNGTRTNDGVDVVKDYSCKKPGCGRKFKTLPELGSHVRSDHKDDPVEDEGVDDAGVVDLSDRTCHICDPPKVLRNAYGLRLHNEKSHPFQSQPEKEVAETEPVPA
jgi:hypothetical protein